LQIFVTPTGIRDHGAHSADWETVIQGVISDNDAASVRASVDAMASPHALERETIGFQGSHKLASRNAVRVIH
jgi:hypothetical protein